MTNVLVVDDDEALAETLAVWLGKRGFTASHRASATDALAALETGTWDVLLTDLNMRAVDGLELCRRVVENRPDIPVLVITAFGSLDTAVAAIRAGAYDFLSKPVEIETLVIAVERAARHRALREEVKRLREEIARPRPTSILGASSPIRDVIELVSRVAGSADISVLITGESGTGKEVVARAIHQSSRRREGRFVAINCAAMPEALLESELFGHVKGAFTDARGAHEGLFSQADGGTLFLDEIADMPIGLQPKLLRALQERTVRPLGGHAEIPIDVRVVAATNRDVAEAIDEKRFREDLYFRINVVQIDLPPLRARGNDVLLLAQYFVTQLAKREGRAVTGISAAAAERLMSYAWPGNVRELRNCVERAVALTRFEQIAVDDLPERIRDYRRSHVLIASDDPTELVPMDEVERRYVQRVMDAVGGNKTAAARVLGLDRKRLYRMLDRLGVAVVKPLGADAPISRGSARHRVPRVDDEVHRRLVALTAPRLAAPDGDRYGPARCCVTRNDPFAPLQRHRAFLR